MNNDVLNQKKIIVLHVLLCLICIEKKMCTCKITTRWCVSGWNSHSQPMTFTYMNFYYYYYNFFYLFFIFLLICIVDNAVASWMEKCKSTTFKGLWYVYQETGIFKWIEIQEACWCLHEFQRWLWHLVRRKEQITWNLISAPNIQKKYVRFR